jgi:MATE family multidrug resistance protein
MGNVESRHGKTLWDIGMDIDLTSPGPRLPGRRHAVWTEARQLLRLALPLVATQLSQMIILATDTVMLGHYGEDALAAAALGNTVFVLAWLTGSGPAFATAPMIAHILGDHPGNIAGVRHVVRMGLWATAILSVPLLAYLLLTRSILLGFGEDPMLAAGAARFMSTLCVGLPFAIGFQVLRNFSTALSRPLAPMVVMGLAILFNGLGDYALIFGHFGLPRLGLLGSGMASAASNIFAFTVLLAIILTAPALRRYRILRRLWRPDGAKLAEVFRLGIPIGLTMIFEVMLFAGAALIMGRFGTETLAAHQIALTIPSLTFMVPLGIGMAATVRVGLAMGANDRVAARRAGFVAIATGALFMTVTALLFILFPHAIVTLWLADIPANQTAIALAVSFLKVAAGFQIADGIQGVASQALRGLKDARAPMWIAIASYWLAGFPVCILLGYGLGLEGLGIWLGLAFGLFVAAASLSWRFIWLSKIVREHH